MTEAELKALLNRTVGSSDEDTEKRIDSCLQLAKDDVLSRKTHWSFVEATDTITADGGNSYDLPTDAHHIVAIWNDDLRVTYMTPFQFRDAYQTISADEDVKEYTIWAEEIVLNAKIATGSDLSCWFEKTPSSITVANFPRADVLFWGALHYYDPKGVEFPKAEPKFERIIKLMIAAEEPSTEQAKKVRQSEYVRGTHQFRGGLTASVK